MNSRPRFANRLPWLCALAVVAGLGQLLWPGTARSQFALSFSNKSGDAAPRAFLPLRPNLTEDFFIYVDNPNGQAATLKVEIRADGKPIDGGVATVDIAATDKHKQVSFGKPAQPGEKPAAPPAPPAFAEIKGALTVVLLDNTDKILNEAPLTVARPKEYVEIKKISFIPKPGGDKKNELKVELKAKAGAFAGPRCRVELVLDPKRIPGLLDSKKAGTRAGFLAEAGSELVLTADNLDFKDDKEQSGLVYLTIDGWERAYTFNTTFPREGTESTPITINSPIVRLLAPKQANPADPLKIKLEADNLDAQVIELGFDRDDDGEFSKLNGELNTYPGSRHILLFFNPAYPGGALQLKSEAKDWSAELDVTDVFGKRNLRARLLTTAAEADKPKDKDRDLDKDLNKDLGGTEPVTELRATVLLDASPPEGVKFVNIPKKLPRGEALPLSAACTEPKMIKEVLFFVGKPGPDGKIPANAIQAPGKLTDEEKGIWSAALDAPTDQKGKIDVSVQFVKLTGLATTDTIKIELVDPGKDPNAAAGGKASIEGKVTDAIGSPQGKGVPVELRDDKGNVKDTTKTDEKSAYVFKDVAPGTYKVFASRTATRTSGSITVQVKEAEKKIDVDVKMSR